MDEALEACFWTGILLSFEEFTWDCLFTVGITAIDTVDRGTTTVAKGNAVKVTGNVILISP
jgi:hypothetical protein